MSAETLRRAAALMRERGEAATPGPWEHYGDFLVWPSEQGPAAHDPVLELGEAHQGSAPHIASWHPAVALAVADLLEGLAESHVHVADEEPKLLYDMPGMETSPAVRLARTYLGEQS